jgi:hypothetical protein
MAAIAERRICGGFTLTERDFIGFFGGKFQGRH